MWLLAHLVLLFKASRSASRDHDQNVCSDRSFADLACLTCITEEV